MSRTRSRGLVGNSWYRVQDYNPSGALTSDVTTTLAAGANGSYETIVDELIENFRSRQALGQTFMNPMVLSKTRRDADVVTYTIGPHPTWGRRVITGTLGCVASVPPTRPAWFNSRISDAKARTLLSAHSKVAEPDFQGLVTLAEAGKTAQMIAKPFGQAIGLINRIAGRKLKLMERGWTAARAFAAAWNEYRFGWKPLLLDVQGIADAYVHNTLSEDKPVRKVARASDANIVWDLPNSVTTASVPVLGTCTVRSNYSHRAKVSSGVLYELYDDTLASATARRMGFRLSDVPSTIWELVPFSFILDRYIDIGVWLNAIVPKPGVRVLGAWTTTIDYQLNYHQVLQEVAYVSSAPATYYYNSGGQYTEEIQSVTRVANPVMPPLPTINYRDLSLVQQIDNLALITAKLAGLKTRS